MTTSNNRAGLLIMSTITVTNPSPWAFKVMRPLVLINPNDTHTCQMVRIVIVIDQLMGLISSQVTAQIPPDTQRFRYRTH